MRSTGDHFLLPSGSLAWNVIKTRKEAGQNRGFLWSSWNDMIWTLGSLDISPSFESEIARRIVTTS